MVNQWSQVELFRVLEGTNTIFTKDARFNIIVFKKMGSEFSDSVTDLEKRLFTIHERKNTSSIVS